MPSHRYQSDAVACERVWKPLQFGKYTGKTLPQVVLKDPDWFFWAYEARALHRNHSAREAEEIYHKATHIVPAWRGQTNWRVEYSYLSPYGTFGFQLIEPGTPAHVGGSLAIRERYIDLSAGRAYKDYDKTGGKLLVDSLKSHVFEGAKLTKKFAEQFFADDENFAPMAGR
jgi:hypothetical protein